mgnify:CR=1 FL=1
MEKKYFGKLRSGDDVFSYTLKNGNGMKASFIDLGATLTSLIVPDREGNPIDVILGYDTPDEYIDNGFFFSAVVGRSGNRIDKAKFTINGQEYQMAVNDNENNLHSGLSFFHHRKWAMTASDEEKNSIRFELLSPDGDQGFPGNFRISVTYTLTEDNELELHYEGISDADTAANMTNHAYFNLDGHDEGMITDQFMMLNAPCYTPVRDSQAIPTGEIAPVAGTPMDFTEEHRIGERIDADFEQIRFAGGYDHNFVICTNKGEKKLMAQTRSEKTGILMQSYTDLPGVQFYAGNFITEHAGKGGCTYGYRCGFCLESQYYPNAINQEGFASPILKAGKKYDTTTSYRFSVR